MNRNTTITIALTILLGAVVLESRAQNINLWRGNETGANWNDTYKWKLKHTPTGSESVHFRQQSSVITVNSTIELGNGMHLYGQELLLEGNGNINLRSPIPHQRTISIPASSSGYANLTLTDNLSINGLVSLAAKTFGTSAGKGSITLKDRTTVAGEVAIGNDGSGTGKIILRDQATYRITRLNIDTLASKGGSAEIHILSGTVRMSVGDNPFEAFLADSSRKIVMGNNGTLHIESDMPVERKKQQLEQMIAQNQIITTSGCKLREPVIRDDMLLLKSERFHISARSGEMIAASEMKSETAMPPPSPQNTKAENPSTTTGHPITPASGYIVFLSALLLFALRPVKPSSDPGANSKQGGVGIKKGLQVIGKSASSRKEAA